MHPTRRIASFVTAVLLSLAASRAQCDLSAIPGDPLRELHGSVDSLALFDPDGTSGPLPTHLVAGGTFDVGNAVDEHVVMWNGTSWVNTNAPFGAVTTMIVWNNLLVAVADELLFTWNGTVWSLLAGAEEGPASTPLPGAVYALAVWNGDLVVGGRFSRITAPFLSLPAVNIAKLNATTGWSAFSASPMTANMSGPYVNALAIFNNTVWVGLGCNTNFSATPTLQFWNAGTWTGQPGWTDPIDTLATRIGTTINNSWMFAAAHSLTTPTFTAAGFNPVLGTTNTFGPPPAAGVNRLEQIFVRGTGLNSYEVAATIATNGNDKVWRWTAAGGWVALPSLTVATGAVTATRVNFFGGRYVAGIHVASGTPQSGLRSHDSVTASWVPYVGPGFDAAVHCICADGAELVIGGAFTTLNGATVNRIARGHAGAWQPLGTGFGPSPSGVTAVARLANGDLVAGGDFTSLGDGTPMNHIARWNGVAWSGIGGGVDNAVEALLPLPNGELIAAGSFATAGGVPASRIARWTGSAWAPLGAGCSDAVRTLLLASNGDIVAGGSFPSAGGVVANGIARWNGASWSAMGTGFDGDVHALTESNDGIVAGGAFLHADGFLAPHAARWNGASWTPFGPVALQPSARIYALATLPGGETVVGGETFTAGTATSTAAAIWRGNTWETLGVRGEVRELRQLPSGRLATAGAIDSVAATVSANVAVIASSCVADTASVAPGCAGSGGSNTLAALTMPWAGGTLRTQATGLPALALVLTVTSFAPIAPGLPLPSVFPQALPGCNLGVAPDILGAFVSASGVAPWELALPGTPQIAGITFYHQMVPLELTPAGALLAVTATNVLRFTVGFF